MVRDMLATINVMALWVLGFSLAGLVDADYWIFDLFSHFKPHYIVVAVTLMGILFFSKTGCRLAYAALSATIVINGVFLFVIYAHPSWPISKSGTSTLKIISINLNKDNKETNLLRDYFEKADPDFLMLQELTPSLQRELVGLRQRYPFSKTIPRDGNFGLGIYSKHAIVFSQIIENEITVTPLLAVDVDVLGKRLRLFNVHPYPPISQEAKDARNGYLDTIGHQGEVLDTAVVVCGDFNMTPWNRVFQKMLKVGRFESASARKILFTWPAGVQFLGLPLDHCLTRGVSVQSYRSGPNVGSDHLPIEMIFTLR